MCDNLVCPIPEIDNFIETTDNCNCPLPTPNNCLKQITNECLYYIPEECPTIVEFPPNCQCEGIICPPLQYEKITVYKEITTPLSYTEICFDWTYIIIIVISLLVYIPFLISYFFGIYSTWYNSLILPDYNHWVTAGLWIAATLISYIGFYILWKNADTRIMYRNLSIIVLYTIGTFLLIVYSILLFQFHSIAGAVWAALILLIYQFWLFVYIWNIDKVAALFLIPLIAMYVFFFYDIVHLASLNNVAL